MNRRAMAIALLGNVTLQQVRSAVHKLFDNWPAVDQTVKWIIFRHCVKNRAYTYHKEGGESANTNVSGFLR